MKTVEERAIGVIDKLFQTPGAGMKHYNQDSFNKVLGPLIAEGMRDLAQECIKIALNQHSDCSLACCQSRRTADSIACQIRRMIEEGKEG
jgi:hypothetical protein